MIWHKKGSRYVSGKYQITQSIRGFELWHYGEHPNFYVIGREFQTAAEAKQRAETHRGEARAVSETPT